MRWLEALKERPDNSLNDRLSFIDADTIKDADGKSYRLQGFDAPEISKFIDNAYKDGEAGGAIATETIARLARDRGFTNLKPVLDGNGNIQLDPWKRQISDLTNDAGESFTKRLISEGIFQPTKYASPAEAAASQLGKAQRQRDLQAGVAKDDWDVARDMIEDGALQEGAKSLGFKQIALNEQQLADAKRSGLGHYFSHSTVQIDHLDRDINNKSLNPFTDSWEQGWISVLEAGFGTMDMMGETTGASWLEDIGEEGVARQREKLASYGETVLDFRDVDNVDEAFQYLGNNFALSIPYMVGTAVGMLGVPATYGASMLLPVSLYTGQVWNEMEGDNKNAAVAVGAGAVQAALDTLGIKGIAASGKPKQMIREAVEKLVTNGEPRKLAEQKVLNATRRQIANFVGDARQIAKDQLKKKQIFKDLSVRVGLGGASEAGTEALQEAIGYTAAHLQEGFDFGDLNNRMISGAVAGAALGGTLSVPGSIYNAGAWADVAYRLEEADSTTASEAGMWAEWERVNNEGKLISVNNILDELEQKFTDPPTEAGGPRTTKTGPSFNERAEAGEKDWKDKTTFEKVQDSFFNMSQYWQGQMRNNINAELRAKSRHARMASDTYGGSNQRIFSGSNFENAKHHQLTTYRNMVPKAIDVYRVLSGRARFLTPSKRGDISTSIYTKLNAAVDRKTGKFNPDLLKGEAFEVEILKKLGEDLNKLAEKMWQDQSKYTKDKQGKQTLGKISNYLFKYKALNKNAIKRNRVEFQNLLVEEFKNDSKNRMSYDDARKLVDEILDNPEVGDVDEGFSVVRGGIVPSSHGKRTLRLSERPSFTKFLEQDLFANVSQAAKSAARFVAHRKYIGKNGEVANRFLDGIVEDGVSPEEVNRLAFGMKNYFDSESGNYKRPTSDQGKAAVRIQKSFMMLTTVASLPLSTISSFVEGVMVHGALTMDQIFGKTVTKNGKQVKRKGSLQVMGEELATSLWQGANEVADYGVGQRERTSTPGQKLLQEVGMYHQEVGAATVTGVTETNQLYRRSYEIFFKAIGMTGWTNFTRAASAAICGDYLTDKVVTLLDADFEVENISSASDFAKFFKIKPFTREQQEADEALRNLGLDVDEFVYLSFLEMFDIKANSSVDPKTGEVVKKVLTDAQNEGHQLAKREAMYNFINNRVPLPGAANRPLIYQDPRFALFTQFQGFMSTFTSTHLPKLWGEYVKRGTPSMKYNAFAMMTTMIMVGFASQYLKDLIKYGGKTPYLDDAEVIQRGIQSSGLLGTGERVLDQFFPLYEQRSDGVGEWMWNTSTGESPALSTAKRLGRATGNLIEGDVESAAYQGLKTTPMLGPFTELNKSLASNLSEWNFKGEQ